MLETLRNLLWGPPLLILILGTGLYLTIILRGIQFRYLLYALKLAFTRHHTHEKGDISHFQALMTALAGMIGIGSIAGVATALATGGPGALFWMIIAALIGMATLYGESFLSLTYRIRDERGEMAGGPMYSIRHGIGWRWLAAFYGAGGAIAAITTGNMVQANAIADVLPFDRWLSGLLLSVLIGLVLFGGIRAIGRVAGVLVPVMALFYCLGGLLILVLNIRALPDAVAEIFVSAFRPQAPLGGFLGASVFMALRMGVARGLFASEAGLGSSSIAAAAARTDEPGRQALINMTSAFLGVCIVCTITGLVIAVTGALPSGLTGVSLTLKAFGTGLPLGKYIVIIGALLFGYSTLLGWAYYGERCSEYLFGERFVPIYRVIYTLAILPGAILTLDIVWGLADIANAFMAIPNLISLLMLGGVIAKGTRVFFKKKY